MVPLGGRPRPVLGSASSGRLAVIFILSMLPPTLVLAWLAIRSLRDQQIISERQRTLLYQGICSGLVKDIIDFMGERETDFGRQVEALIAAKGALPLARDFDEQPHVLRTAV